MRADDDIDFAGFEVGENFLLLGGGAKAAEHLDARGKGSEAALESLEMLETEYGGGSEAGDLFAVGNGFEGGAHGHFGFSSREATAEEAIHGRGALHVALDVGDGGVLVVGFLELESVFEFALEVSVGGECETGGGFALGVEGEKLLGHIFDGFAGTRFAGVPGGAA